MTNNAPSPEFIQAFNEFKAIASVYGLHSDKAKLQLTKAMQHAPPAVIKELDSIAKQMGLLPPATAYGDNGEPLVSLSDIARHFGISESKVIADFNKMEKAGISAIYQGNINPIQ